jgi:O-antigen/teichoic acid export membrane protein
LGVSIGFVSSILVLPRIISKDEYGLVQLLIALPILFAEYIGLGFSTMMTRMFIYFKDSKSQHHGFMFLSTIWFILGLIVFIIVFYFFRDYIIDEKNSELLSPYLFYAIPLTIAAHIFLVLERYLRYTTFNASFSIFLKEIGVRIGILVTAFLYYLKVIKFDQFILLYCCSQVIPATFLLSKLIWKKEISFKQELGFINREMMIKMIRISLYGIVMGILASLAQSFTQVTLAKLISLSAVSSYAIAVIISNVISVPLRVTHLLADPLLRSAYMAGDHNRVFDIYEKSCLIQTIIGLYFYLCVFLNIDHIVQVLPPTYFDCKFMILVICLGTLFDMITGANDAVIGTSPKYQYGSIFPLAMALFTVSFNLFLIPRYGVRGAAVATMITFFLYNILRFLFILIFLKLQPYGLKYLILLLLAGGVGLVVYNIPRLDNFIFDLILRIGLISLFWIGIIYKFNFSQDITNLMNLGLKKIRLIK